MAGLTLLAFALLAVMATLAFHPGGRAFAGPAAQATGTETATTPEATGTPGVSPNITTVVRLETDNPTTTIKKKTEFEVRIQVDNVEHLGTFGVTIQYDPKKLRPVLGSSIQPGASPEPTALNPALKSRSVGEFLASSPRGTGIVCDASSRPNYTVVALCASTMPPICLGGPAGASGSGLLGAIYFEGIGGGSTTLKLVDPTQLVGDDPAPGVACDPENTDNLFATIPSQREDLTVKIESGGGSSGLIIVVAVIVVVVAIGGAGGYMFYRTRQSGGPAAS